MAMGVFATIDRKFERKFNLLFGASPMLERIIDSVVFGGIFSNLNVVQPQIQF